MKDICMKFYNENEELYFETDALQVGLGAGLLQVREGMTCPRDIPPDSSILCQISFTCKTILVWKCDAAI